MRFQQCWQWMGLALIVCLPGLHATGVSAQMTSNRTADSQVDHQSTSPHPYAGLWVTADGQIRHRLLPNGRYTEARGSRENAYEGRYVVRGDHINYWDDTGFTADGDFVEGVLHHAGMIFYRRE